MAAFPPGMPFSRPEIIEPISMNCSLSVDEKQQKETKVNPDSIIDFP
jgi:hypothetical protein